MIGDILRGIVRRANRLSQAARVVCMPWLLLVVRIWLSQVVFVHRIMLMMATGQEHGVPAVLQAVAHGVGPLLLATGLLTRPVALALLVETAWEQRPGVDVGMTGLQVALLAWLVVMGPGVLSLDHPLGRGLSWIPFRPVRVMHWLYGGIDQILGPLLRLGLRASLAALVAAPVLPADFWVPDLMLGRSAAGFGLPAAWAALLAMALALGCATRFAALILAGMIPLAGITMSMDDRLAILLLCLMFAASGAGMLSIDYLLACWAHRVPRRDTADEDRLPHVVVVGGGFGGVAAVHALRDAACRITLIDLRNHHLFQPLLYQVATAALSPAEIATPIRSLFRGQRNVRVHLGEVTGVDPAARTVRLGTGCVGFDYLILATGARHSYFGRDDWAPFAPGLKNIEDATSIRSRLLRAFEEAESASNEAQRVAWLTFVIVGGGPTGIELAGAIAELARHGMDQEYRSIDPTTARVILVQSAPRILPSFPAALSAAAERSLRALGVDVRLATRVLGVDEDGVDIGPERITARTVLWAAGVAASPAAQWLGRAGDASGRLAVGPDLSVPDLPSIYAIGDTAACRGWRGAPVPGLAPAAKQQGRYAAEAINAALMGRPPPPPFRYRHFGSLATIGRQAAVAELGGFHMWGAPAWWFWGAAHVTFLVGGRNRATVVMDWLWAYVTYRRSTRLITGAGQDMTPITARRS